MMDFDYESPSVPATAVSDIAAEIANAGKPLPLTLEQIQQRKLDAQLHALACLQRDEERRFERERKRVEAEEEAQRQAAIAQAEAARKAQRERRERIDREYRERELRDLRLKVTQQDWWQKNVDGAARNTVRRQQMSTTMGELEQMINPPSASEPEVVYVEATEGSDQLGTRDFNYELWAKKPRSWW
jgi:hypothetical protein